MKYRGIEYAVVQDVDWGTWIWTVNLIDGATESGLRKTREGALTAVVLTIDRWIRNKNPVPVALPAQRARRGRWHPSLVTGAEQRAATAPRRKDISS